MLTEERIAIFFEGFCSALTMPAFTIYLLRLCGESLKNKLFYAVVFLFGICLILLGVAQVTEIFYYVTVENFFRGRLYYLFILPVVLMMFLNIFGVIRRKKFLSKRYFFAFLLYLYCWSNNSRNRVFDIFVGLWNNFFYGSNGCNSFF